MSSFSILIFGQFILAALILGGYLASRLFRKRNVDLMKLKSYGNCIVIVFIAISIYSILNDIVSDYILRHGSILIYTNSFGFCQSIVTCVCLVLASIVFFTSRYHKKKQKQEEEKNESSEE